MPASSPTQPAPIPEPSVDVLRGGIRTTTRLREWVRSDVPFPAVAAGEACPMCLALDQEATGAFDTAETEKAVQQRRLLHRSLHAEIMLLLEDLLDSASAASYRDPAWTEESVIASCASRTKVTPSPPRCCSSCTGIASDSLCVGCLMERWRSPDYGCWTIAARYSSCVARWPAIEVSRHARLSGFCGSPVQTIIKIEWNTAHR